MEDEDMPDTSDKVVPMPRHPKAHTDDHVTAFLRPKTVNTIAQVITFSPHGFAVDDGGQGIDWIYYIAENVYGCKFDKFPSFVQNNVAEYAGRLCETINNNRLDIEGDMFPRRLLFYLMSIHDPDPFDNRPAYGHFYAAIRNFLELDTRGRKAIISKCIKHFEEHPSMIKKRDGELL